eukprot:CAMPEP_0172765154 /NCGR_PEP_ID=MMETSP1074-20121228/178729_1 /TAXON_ID=2916 /ORGANISM="Ceratium fusus, Strain PA161109" /LENGTH=44 /DNA_ID= /DNA_START= /DNA_END= /DNA_ORIENTATION=
MHVVSLRNKADINADTRHVLTIILTGASSSMTRANCFHKPVSRR